MRKLSAAAAAALLLAPTVANARNTEINLDGFCDLVAFQVSTPTVVGFSDDTCEGGIWSTIRSATAASGRSFTPRTERL